jgi:hypothetical protein
MAIIWVGTGRFNAYIGPVQDYIDRVVAADVAAGNTLGLDVGVRDSYDVFIRDSLDAGHLGSSGGVISQANSIIKAAAILAGARTLAGALVPLVGPAPTSINFVDADYNRKTGLLGNGLSTASNKRLNSNRLATADGQDNCHLAIYATSASTQAVNFPILIGANNSQYCIGFYASNKDYYWRAKSATTVVRGTHSSGFIGLSRAASSSFSARYGGATQTLTSNSTAISAVPVLIFAGNNSNNTAFSEPSSPRISFYSIGSAIGLSPLDSRVATLMASLAAAIP